MPISVPCSVRSRLAGILALLAACLAPLGAARADTALEELRRSFTVGGKVVPPEIFADFGDSDLFDPVRSICVTIDVLAAVGSSRYAGSIAAQPDGWITQRRVSISLGMSEIIGYSFVGATQDGLLIVLTSYTGGSMARFYNLHVLDAAPGRALYVDDKPYERLNLTVVRTLALGDRWRGKVEIKGNSVAIIAAGQGAAAQVFEARRP